MPVKKQLNAAVGVDIGCGMAAVELSINASQLPDNLKPLRLSIEAAVPVGFEKHARPTLKPTHIRRISQDLEGLVSKHPGLLKMVKRFGDIWPRQLGTLGGGNHFIELCVDTNDGVWLMLHSGSRGVGARLCGAQPG